MLKFDFSHMFFYLFMRIIPCGWLQGFTKSIQMTFDKSGLQHSLPTLFQLQVFGRIF